MERSAIPLVILGGRDRRGTVLPESGRAKHHLKGYKAVDIRFGDRPLIALVSERLRASGAFDPIYVAGPERVYRDVCPELRIIDTDLTFGMNLKAAIEGVMAEDGGHQVAFTTCDILPDANELKSQLEDYWSHAPCDFWAPQILVPDRPEALGESGWKPQYKLRLDSTGEPVATLPGHLVIVDPIAVRRKLVFHMLELAYRSRNRPVKYRRGFIMRRVLFSLLAHDLANLLRLRPPILTWEVVGNGLALARGLRAGTLTESELADLTRNLYVHRKHRKKYPERRGRMPVLEGLSLAKDIDTEEEALEAARRMELGI